MKSKTKKGALIALVMLSMLFGSFAASMTVTPQSAFACSRGDANCECARVENNRGVMEDDCHETAPATQENSSDGGSGNAWDDFWGGAQNLGIAVILSPIAVVSYLIFSITAFFLGIAAWLFNQSVVYLIFQFSDLLGNSTGMLTAWGILRDFGNIALLFGFIFMGISTILDLHSYPWKKALPTLVIFAVLLNFSLFAAEAVIDATNVLAAQLYQNTFGIECAGQDTTQCAINGGVAGTVLQNTGLASVFANNNNIAGDYLRNPVGVTLGYLGMAVFMITAAVVFIAGAVLIVSRAITLAFIMVTSPIGFAGMAVPPLAGIAKQWWDKLISQALFAPVFLLLLLVSLKLTEGLKSIIGSGSLANAIANGSSIDAGPILFFVLVIGFMIGALLISKQFGIYGADVVTKQAMGVIGGATGAMTFGAAGWGLRRTLGGTANIASRSLRTGRLRALGTMPIIGKRITGAADRVASTSFDGRGKGGPLGAAGEAAQKGAKGERAAITKGEDEFRKSITEQEVEDYKNLKAQKQSFRDVVDKQLGSDDLTDDELYASLALAAPGTPTAKMAGNMQKMQSLKAKMDATPEGKREIAKEKLEKRDDHAKEWSEAEAQLKEANANLVSIATKLANPPAGGHSAADLARLNTQHDTYDKQRQKAEDTQTELNPKILKLTDELKRLRKEIKKDESRYRKGVQDVARPNFPLNPIDRRALHGFTVKKTDETVFKPKDLTSSLPRAFRVKNNL